MRESDEMQNVLDRLLWITEGCRDDMHEPDEQGLSARVVGEWFDNAGTDNEMKIILMKEEKDESQSQVTLNLATVIALARKAKL